MFFPFYKRVRAMGKRANVQMNEWNELNWIWESRLYGMKMVSHRRITNSIGLCAVLGYCSFHFHHSLHRNEQKHIHTPCMCACAYEHVSAAVVVVMEWIHEFIQTTVVQVGNSRNSFDWSLNWNFWIKFEINWMRVVRRKMRDFLLNSNTVLWNVYWNSLFTMHEF